MACPRYRCRGRRPRTARCDDVKALSEAAPADISANSAAFRRLFDASRRRPRFYSGAMLSHRPVRPARAHRAASPRVGVRRVAGCACSPAGVPANADEPPRSAGRARRRPARPGPHARARQGRPHPGAARVEVVVGQLDPRLHLAACDGSSPICRRTCAYGASRRIGLRCKEGTTLWNVFLPITVKVYGRALVVPAGGAAGSVLADADLAEAEVDLAEEFTPTLVDAEQVVGRTLAQALKPGQALRQGHLKVAPVVRGRRDRQAGRRRRRLRARGRGPGAQQRHRRPAGPGPHRERPRRHRPADRRAPPGAGLVKAPRAPGELAKKL